MPIVPSRAGEIERLIAALGSPKTAERDSACARLTLLGERAVDPLLRALPGSRAKILFGALAVLEPQAPDRALGAILALVEHEDAEVARRALEVLAAYPGSAVVAPLAAIARDNARRPLPVRCAAVAALGRLHSQGLLAALGPLVEILLDEGQDDGARLAALACLRDLPATDRRDVLRRLAGTRSVTLAAELETLDLETRVPPGSPPVTVLLERLERAPRASPDLLRIGRSLAERGEAALGPTHSTLARSESPLVIRILADTLAQIRAVGSIPALHSALRRVAARPAVTADPDWSETRVHLHLALAALGSRLALYDLRELLAQRPLRGGPGLLHAAATVGDSTLIGPLVALAHDEPAHLEDCREVLAAIVGRLRLRRGARLWRGLQAQHHALLDNLWPVGHRRHRS